MRVSKKELKQDVLLIIAAVILVLILGATIFHLIEGWTYLDSFYFVTMTATTVGYGDFTPTHTLSKVITIAYSLSIVPFVLYAFSFVAKAQISKVYTKIHHLERQQKSQEEEIDSTQRKINLQKAKIKAQEEELSAQEKHIKESLKAIRETEKELEAQKRKISKEHRINKEQANEISSHDKELEVVEEIMEKELSK